MPPSEFQRAHPGRLGDDGGKKVRDAGAVDHPATRAIHDRTRQHVTYPSGLGDVSDTHIHWRHPTRAPYVSSLLWHDGLLYMATEHGVLTVTDATSGAIVWRERLGGVFTASPVAAGDHVYFLNESGETAVIRPGREPTVVSRNRLGERSLASPAVVEGLILIRTDQHLFCIDGQDTG